MATLYGMRLLAPEKVPQEVQGTVFLKTMPVRCNETKWPVKQRPSDHYSIDKVTLFSMQY